MKRKRLLLLLALLMTAATGATAQTETLADGSYYVKNGALSLYMAAGGKWGTQGIVNERGLDLIFTYNSGTKTYTIDSRLYNGDDHFLGTNFYMDAPSFGWTVEGENSFTISAKLDGVKHYLAVDQNNILVFTEDGTAENAQWTIIPKADNENAVLTAGLDAMKAATAENGVDATFLIASPGFNRNDKRNAEAWTIEANHLEMGGAGSEGNGCAESFNSTFTLSQTLSNAPAGVYTLTAQGFYNQNGSDNENLPYFYANDEKQTFKLLEDQVHNMSGAGPLFTQGKYTIDPITVVVAEDGVLTIGAKLETNTTLWSCWDNFKLTYYGPLMYSVTLADGTKDAGKWTAKVGEGQAQALPIGGLKGDGSETVTLQYNGRLKVKGVKATSDAAPAVKPAATVTTVPTGAAVVGVGKTTELVSGGAANGGTLMYAVTTTNTKPTSTAGFSDAVPTAQSITASGKVYVWYYVKADDTHTDSEIAATAIEVPVADIVWDATNISDLQLWGTDESYTKEGVTLSCNAENISAEWADYGDPATAGIFFAVFGSGGYTFTAPTGKAFTKIEMKAQGPDGWNEVNLGARWAYIEDGDNEIFTVTWTGSAASTDKLLPDIDDFSGSAPVKSIAFYLVDAE